MSGADLATQMLEHLIAGVTAARRRFDPSNGRFPEEDGSWRVASQDVIYPMAVLYTTDHPDNPYRNDEDIFRLIARGGDALRSLQNEQGHFAAYKNNALWGYNYNCWSMYHWMESFVLVKEQLDRTTREQWERGLRLAFAGSARDHTFILSQEKTWLSNKSAWHCMALVRAAAIFGEPTWREIGERYIRFVVDSQEPDGYWPENVGPSTAYNLMWTHVLGLYYHITGDKAVLPSLERALQFHLLFTYPDGSCVETIDGRCLYEPQPFHNGFPAFSIFPQGRRLIRYQLAQYRKYRPGGGTLADVAAAYVHLSDDEEEPIPQERSRYVALHHDRALVRREAPWFYCMSAYTTPGEALFDKWHGRWYLDRQNLLSIWHDRLGLLIGGGNSKGQPEFSTFAVVEGRMCWLEPSNAAIQINDAGEDQLQLKYGKVGCTLSVIVRSSERLDITFQACAADASTRVRAGLTLRPRHGADIAISGLTEPTTVDPKAYIGQNWPESAAEDRAWVKADGWELQLPGGSGVLWPVYPHNPYSINCAASPATAILRAYVDILPGDPPKTLTLKVSE